MAFTVKDLIESLTNLNNVFKGVAESVKNLEENELELYKTNTELKYSLIKEIGDVTSSLRQFESNFSQALLKIDFNDETINRNLQEIKELIKNTDSMSPDCKDCKLVQTVKDGSTSLVEEKDKWNKRLWTVVIFLGITVLTLLGLNVTNLIKLSGAVVSPTSIIGP
jgi:chromosome segregation ATPase